MTAADDTRIVWLVTYTSDYSERFGNRQVRLLAGDHAEAIRAAKLYRRSHERVLSAVPNDARTNR